MQGQVREFVLNRQGQGRLVYFICGLAAGGDQLFFSNLSEAGLGKNVLTLRFPCSNAERPRVGFALGREPHMPQSEFDDKAGDIEPLALSFDHERNRLLFCEAMRDPPSVMACSWKDMFASE